MNFVKLELSLGNTYSYVDASTITMNILGSFLSTIGCHKSMYKEWALADKSDPQGKFGYSCGANIIFLEEEDNDIYLSGYYSEEEIPSRLKMSKEQFVMLLDDWQEKVCSYRPKNVIIKSENNQFFIGTYE